MGMYSAQVTERPRTYPLQAFNSTIGFALTASPFCQTATKGTKKALPQRTAFAALRFPRSGPAPWPRRDGPSMAQHGSPGIHAGRTTTQNLRSASRRGLKIKIKSRSKADQKRPCRRCFDFCFLLLKTMSLPPLDSRNDADAHHRRPNAGAVVGVARQDAEPAVPGHGWPVTACPHNSAGVRAPGEPRRARPYGRAQTFWFLLGRLPKGTRCKSETDISVKRL